MALRVGSWGSWVTFAFFLSVPSVVLSFRVRKHTARSGTQSGASLLVEEGELHQHSGNHTRALELGHEALAALKSAQESKRQQEEEAHVKSLLGRAMYSLGDVESSEQMLRQAAELQADLPPGHPDVVEVQIARALNRREYGDLQGTLAMLQTTEDALRAQAEEGPEELGLVLDVKAVMLSESGRRKEAVLASREALKHLLAAFGGEEHWRVAQNLDRHGLLLQEQGLAREALKEHERALKITLATLGERHRRTSSIYNNIALCHQALGQLAEADAQFSRALDVELAVAGARGPNVAIQHGNIANLRLEQGRPAEAVRLLEDAVSMLRDAGLPAGVSPHLSSTVRDLARARRTLAQRSHEG